MDPYEAPSAAPAPSKRKRWLLIAAVVAIAFVVGNCVLFLVVYNRLTSGPQPQTQAATPGAQP